MLFRDRLIRRLVAFARNTAAGCQDGDDVFGRRVQRLPEGLLPLLRLSAAAGGGEASEAPPSQSLDFPGTFQSRWLQQFRCILLTDSEAS